MTYKGFTLIREIKGVSARWHVEKDGQRLTLLGYRSKAAAKRFINSQI